MPLRRRCSLIVAAALLAGCGSDGDDEPAAGAAPPVMLSIRYDDGNGRVRKGDLTCTPSEQRATGSLAGRAPVARQCSHARDIAPMLTQPPPAGRACTEVYGGPEVVRITGTIGGRAVDRRFGRTNGCEIADFARIAGALGLAGRRPAQAIP